MANKEQLPALGLAYSDSVANLTLDLYFVRLSETLKIINLIFVCQKMLFQVAASKTWHGRRVSML